MAKKGVRDNRLDVDAGYLAKSPCKECNRLNNLPGCSENCDTLSQLQKRLIGVISASNNFSEFETYSVSLWND